MIHELEEQFDVGYMADPRSRGVRHDAEEAQLRALGYTIGETLEDHGTWEARKAEIDATKAEARRSRASSPRRASPSRRDGTRASGSSRRRARP